MNPRRKLDEDTLRQQLTSAAQLIDPRPPTRDELNALHRRPRRGHRALRMSPPLLVAAAVAAIAVAATTVAIQHRSEPRPPATQPPGPTTPPPTTPAQRPSTATSPNHPSRQATTTPPVSTPPASPTSPSTPATNAPSVLPLVRGPYGFSIPAGWHAQPLTNYGGSGSWASFTRDPATAVLRAPAPYAVVYSISASAGLLYTQDGKPVLSEAVNYSLCPVAHWQAISPSAVSFTCASVSGMQPQGILIVEPHAGGTKQLIVTLPAEELATATVILNSFH
jgi:cytoskeletal protein RodZ